MQHENWLLELTALASASGHEDRVIQWVRRWARRRKNVTVKTDSWGNVELRMEGMRSVRPIYFVAHMDHPAFVVTRVVSRRRLEATFRGHVDGTYFNGSRVLLYHKSHPPQYGTVHCPAKGPRLSPAGDKQVSIIFCRDATALPGDVITWDIGKVRIRGGRLFTLAADNLAGVAVALSAFDRLRQKPTEGSGGAGGTGGAGDVRLLLTRGEEVGFLGAIGACQDNIIPKRARIIVLENSKAFDESPIGNGPVVRVGDPVSIFNNDLTWRISQIARQLQLRDPKFKWQRKLMPGGACEASAFQAFGYICTCLCLPLGNYHNMNEAVRRIGPETISLWDYHGLIQLLIAVGQTLDAPGAVPVFKRQLTDIFTRRRHYL